MRRIVLGILLVLEAPVLFAEPAQTTAALATACRERDTALGIDWRPHSWDCRIEPARTLSQALRYQEELFGIDDVSYRVGINSPVCQTLRASGMVECNYMVHHTLVGFLTMYGVDMFPVSSRYRVRPADTQYTGYGSDSDTLIRAIVYNQDLFADGELTREEIKQWQRAPRAE